ncbi:MAG: Gfo/Idh/MocA family oxidoreductase [Bacteroidales bacterium]|nr:Gfo/Idh/MocA family oxidoreductase [Bacteroidales bacterium]
MKEIGWGIIGCGNVTEQKSGPAFSKVEGSRLVAVMRRDEVRAEDYAKRHHVPRWYSDARRLIGDPDVNAVYIATPPSSHARYALEVMEAGKAVYVEKPMAASWNDCIRMNEFAAQKRVPLYVAYYRRALPYFKKVQELVREEQIGKLLFVEIDYHVPPRSEDTDSAGLPWRLVPEISGGGYFYDIACHQIDLMIWLFGRPVKIWGHTFQRAGLYPPEDLVFAGLEFGSGLPLSGSWCFVADRKHHTDVIRIYGTEGSVEFSTFRFTPIRQVTQNGTVEFLPPNPEHIQLSFIRNMVEELRGLRDRTCNGEDAALTNYIMDKVLGKI